MTPPTPSPNDQEIIQHGLQHLVQHNSNTSYPQQQYEEAVQSRSSYGSPAPSHNDYVFPGEHSRQSYQQPYGNSGFGIQYEYPQDFQSPMYTDQQSTPGASSPTPSNYSTENLKARSGLAIQKGHHSLRPMPDGRSRVKKEVKTKKPKKERNKKAQNVTKLDKPLSEMTKDLPHVAILDIEAYVNRSAEVRQKEVSEGKVPGKVKRPMNSFMLYRKAYQNMAKEWCLLGNHQVVSTICGASWPMESSETKKQFEDWSEVEKQNHKNAHPGYKFTPSKNEDTKMKRKQSEGLSEESDLDDYEWRDGPTRRKRQRHLSPPEPQVVAYPTNQSAYKYTSRNGSRESSVGPSHEYRSSAWVDVHPGRPLPAQYSQAELSAGQYWQQHTTYHPTMPGVENVILRKTTAPGMQHPLVGLPGGQGHGMMDPHEYQYLQQTLGVPQHGEQRIDPSLLAHDQLGPEGSQWAVPMPQDYYNGSQTGDQQWQPLSYEQIPMMPFLDPELAQDGTQIEDPHTHVLKGNQEGWEVLDGGGEFDNWMGGDEDGEQE